MLVLAAGCASAPRPRAAVAPPRPAPPAASHAAQPPAPRPKATPEPPTAAEPPGALAVLGDPVPLTLLEVGRTGRWIAACVARADTNHDGKLEVTVAGDGRLGGDALVPELFVGAAPAEPIDDLFGFDPKGRYLVVRQAGHVRLLDTSGGAPVDLGELGLDTRDDVLDYRQHRALAFDPRGELLAYVRRGASPGLVLRELATGRETPVPSLGGEVWRLAWDGRGDALVAFVMSEDTSGNGRIDFPVALAKEPRLRCQGPIPHFRVASETGDRPSSVVVGRDGQHGPPSQDLALPFGTDRILRSRDGALVLHRGERRIPLSSADCSGRVLAADPDRQLLLMACSGKVSFRAKVELVGPAYRLPLGLELQPLALDRWPEPPARLVPLYPGPDTVLVDLERRRTLATKPGDRVLATLGTRAYLLRGRALVVFDAERGAERVLLDDAGGGDAPIVAGFERRGGLVRGRPRAPRGAERAQATAARAHSLG